MHLLRKLAGLILKFWTRSIRRQLILGVAMVHAVLMTIFVLDLVSRQSAFLKEQEIKETSALADMLAANCTSWLLAGDLIGLEEVVHSQTKYPGVLYVMVLGPGGQVAAHSDRQFAGKYVTDEISRSLITGPVERRILVRDGNLVDTASPVVAGNRHIGWARVGVSQATILRDLKTITRNGLGYMVAAIVIGTIFAWFVAKGVTGGLRRLVHVARETEKGNRSLRVHPVRDNELGELGHAFDQMLDAVTAAEADNLSAREEWERTFDTVPELISILDKDCRIVRINKAMADRLGKSLDGCCGDLCYTCLHGTGPSPSNCRLFDSQRDQKQGVLGEVFLECFNGWFIVSISQLLDKDGNLVGSVHVAHDITERKEGERKRAELERQLLHSQKLESLGVLAGGIAHDFNNLLMAILGNLDLVLLDLSPSSPARFGIEQAVQASRRATDLTRQMLAYSGKGRFMVRKVDLSVLARENVDLFRAAIARTVTLNLNLAPLKTVTEADPGQVQQVVMNLITNAAEALEETAGVITLSTGVMECDEAYLNQSRLEEKPKPGTFVYVEVSDTGCGMDEETSQRLFDPFFTTKFTGRGLGMSAVLGIVRGHHGAILIDTALGRGTSIRVLFPVCEPESDLSPVVARNSPPLTESTGDHRKVLVADDEETVRHLFLRYMERLGFEGIGAADGEEAVALFEKHADSIAFVLLDLTMPRMDGVSTAKEIRRIRPDVRVLLASGYSEQDAVKRFAGEGLSGFIQKPCQLEDLQGKVAQVFQGLA